MPLISPKNEENRRDFNNRCMSNTKMNKEYSNQDQRFAVCNSIWERKKVDKLTKELSKK